MKDNSKQNYQTATSDPKGTYGTSGVTMSREEAIEILRALDGAKRKLQAFLK
ncbi:MAG: hypothetical protein WC294_00135 [Methanoregula sp.]|jgi:hypothetical protein